MPKLWVTASEETIIWNSEPWYLYLKDHDNTRFWNITFEEKEFEVSKRIRVTLVIDSSGDIKTFKIKKVKLNGWKWEEENNLSFSSFSIDKIISFLWFLNENITRLKEWKIQLTEVDWEKLNVSKNQIESFLETDDWHEIIKEFLNNKTTKEEIINLWYRKEQLNIFYSLLNQDWYKAEYKIKIWKENTKDETMWQYFFNKNDWIFWYWLDYKYLWILQKEAHISDVGMDWTNEVISDFLLGDDNFTVLVELKKDDTPLFNESVSGKNRAKSWKISSDLMLSVSQILEQKASWQIKSEQENYSDDWSKIYQKTINPKCFLIIWRLDKLSNNRDDSIKKRTFELFRRDFNSIEIITYDELYKRANFIVNK